MPVIVIGRSQCRSSHHQCQSVEYTTFPLPSSTQPGLQHLQAHQPAFSRAASLPPACLHSQSAASAVSAKCRAQFSPSMQGTPVTGHAQRQASSMPASTCAVTTLAHDSCRARQLLLPHKRQPVFRSTVQASRATVETSQPVRAGVIIISRGLRPCS